MRRSRRPNKRQRRVMDLLAHQANRAISRLTLDRGRTSEGVIGDLLAELRQAGEIVDFEAVPAHSPDDCQGIDYWITLAENLRMPLQVKSSMAGLRDHLRKHGTDIPVIVAVRGQPDKTLHFLRLRIRQFKQRSEK